MSKRICLALATLGVATLSSAKPISDISQLTSLRKMLTITFTEQRFADDHSLADLGQPFEKFGLILPSQKLKNQGSSDALNGGEAVVSTEIDKATNSNVQTLDFVYAQKEVGFDISDKLATQITVTAFDRSGNELESVTLPGSKDSRFVGFAREKAEITEVKISAAHASLDDAMSSPTTIDDITFASPLAIDSNNLLGAPGSSGIALGLTGFGVTGEVGGAMTNSFLGSSADLGGDPGTGPSHSGLRGNVSQGAPLPVGNFTNNNNLGPADPVSLSQVPSLPEPTSVAILGMLGAPIMMRRKRNQAV